MPSFLNPILLIGALAFLIPLVIHLLNKRKLQTIEWGPMHLLREARREKRRRPRIEQWLLLLTRMLIPVLLALGLAVPALHHFGIFKGSPARATAYAVDNSASMRTLEGNSTRLGSAQALLGAIGKERPSGSSSFLIAGDGEAISVENDDPLAGADSADGGKEDLQTGAPFAPAAALRKAAALLSESDKAARELVVVSDFQSDDWSGPGRESIRDALAEMENLDPAPVVTFLRAGGTSDELVATGNLSLLSVEPSVPVVAPKQPIRLSVSLRRSETGTLPDDFRVELRGEAGQLLDEADCRCAAGESTQVIFATQFEKEGDHPLEIRIRTTDALAADNVRHLVVPVWPSLKVTLLGERGSGRLDPLDFLEFALQPNRSARLQGVDLVSTGLEHYDRISESTFREKRVVVLFGAPRLRDDRLPHLEKFVKEGGGLLIIPDGDLDANWYRDVFFKNGEGLLPAPFGNRERLEAGEGVVLDGTQLFHSVSSYFQDERNGDVTTARIRSYFQADPKASNDIETILQLRSNEPLLIEKRYGKGRVAQLTTSIDPGWNNLPLQPFFVPLLQRLIVHLSAGTTFPANVEAGDSVAVEVPKNWGEEEVVLVDPSGRETTLQVGNPSQPRNARASSNAGAGFYRFKRPPGRGDEQKIVAASVPADDSELLSEAELTSMVEELGVGYAPSLEAYRKLDKDRSFGRVIWRWFAIALLLFLFLELFLQQWMARTR